MQVKSQYQISKCEGKGVRTVTISQKVLVPTGTDTETALKFPKMGSFNGDLIVNIKVTPHSYFKRKGKDIHTDKQISIGKAVLGGKANIATIYGRKEIDIDPGSTSGTVIAIPNYGICKSKKNSYGNHYVHLLIKVPNSLSEDQKELMERYAAAEDPITSDDPGM